MSGAGPYQQYRYWGTTKADLLPGTQTLRIPLTPDNWSDVYGQNGAANPAAFQAALDDLNVVGFTFGGQDFAGHGAYVRSGVAHFTLKAYAVGP